MFALDSDDEISIPSTNGDWEISDEEENDRQHCMSQGLTQDKHGLEKNVEENAIVPRRVIQQTNDIMRTIKASRGKKGDHGNIIPGYSLRLMGRHFYLSPKDKITWKEFRTTLSIKEVHIRSATMLKKYLMFVERA